MTDEVSGQIPPIQSYDPFLKFITGVLKLGPLSFGVLVFLANVVVDLWLGFRYDVFFAPAGVELPGLLQDFTAIVVDFVSIPVIAGLYVWTTQGATRLFRRLYQSTVFQDEQRFVENVDRSRPLFRSRLAFHLIWIVSVLYALSQLAAYMDWVPWETAQGYLYLQPVMSFWRTPFWLLNFYTLAYAAFNVAVTVVTLRRLFRTEKIKLLPLHPDKCGGLVSISQYSLKIGYAIASAGLVISAAALFELQQGSLREAYPIIVGVIAYIVLSPVFFFWPLGTAHSAMQEAKDAELLRLAQRYDRIYNRLKKEFDNLDDYDAEAEKLQHLKDLYAIAEDFPVWPFDISNLRRFFAVVTAPLVPALISILIDFIIAYLRIQP